MKQPVLLAVLALTSLAVAQRAPASGQWPGPIASVPVAHPPLANQPSFDCLDIGQPAAPLAAKTAAAKLAPRPIDPNTQGAKVAGKELKQAVKKVAALRWHEDPVEARAESAATGKPMLWVYALGDLDGFA